MPQYKMIQVPPDITINSRSMTANAPDPRQVAAQFLETLVNQAAEQGWEFYRVDAIGVRSNPGCLAALFGARSTEQLYYVITFKRG